MKICHLDSWTPGQRQSLQTKGGFHAASSSRLRKTQLSRHLIPRPTVEQSPRLLLLHSSPLLEKERDTRLPALIADSYHPLPLQRTRPRTRLAAHSKSGLSSASLSERLVNTYPQKQKGGCHAAVHAFANPISPGISSYILPSHNWTWVFILNLCLNPSKSFQC